MLRKFLTGFAEFQKYDQAFDFWFLACLWRLQFYNLDYLPGCLVPGLVCEDASTSPVKKRVSSGYSMDNSTSGGWRSMRPFSSGFGQLHLLAVCWTRSRLCFYHAWSLGIGLLFVQGLRDLCLFFLAHMVYWCLPRPYVASEGHLYQLNRLDPAAWVLDFSSLCFDRAFSLENGRNCLQNRAWYRQASEALLCLSDLASLYSFSSESRWSNFRSDQLLWSA